MPKLALRAVLFTRYEITDQEAREVSILLRAAAQILAPDADEQMSAFIADSGYSRQTVYRGCINKLLHFMAITAQTWHLPS